MQKALLVLLLASLVGVGLRYALPKDMIFTEQKYEAVDDILEASMQEDELPKDMVDTIEIKKDTIPKDIIQEEIPEENVESLSEPLSGFFQKLSRLKNDGKGQVRIAYFGDSLEDADMIVMQLRHYLQKNFGGEGVGFVPITSPSASGRYSIKHSFEGDWNKETFLRKNDTIFKFGLSGETFFVGKDTIYEEASVTYRRGGAYLELPLINPILFYGKEQKYSDSILVKAPILVIKSDEKVDSVQLSAQKMLNKMALPNYQKKITLTMKDSGTIPLYGVSFASKGGVILDNLSVRGNSGLPLTRLNISLMKQFQKTMNYDLLIVSYGTNVFSSKYGKSYHWYVRRMQRVVHYLQKCFPNSAILLVSMADKAEKVDDQMQTPEKLPEFIANQQEIAEGSGVAFFNLYEAMGGNGSMIGWVEQDEPWANKDYTHFNSKGAEKVADLFYNWLMQGFDKYSEEVEKEEQVANEEVEKQMITEMQSNTESLEK